MPSNIEKFQELNQRKSLGPNGWHLVFLKSVSDLIALLFQKSTNEVMVTSWCLETCITTVHKKYAKNIFENYRPRFITSIICKLMESIVRDKIVIDMKRITLFSQMQHGCVPPRSCIANLLLYWTNMLENRHPIDITYINIPTDLNFLMK